MIQGLSLVTSAIVALVCGTLWFFTGCENDRYFKIAVIFILLAIYGRIAAAFPLADLFPQ